MAADPRLEAYSRRTGWPDPKPPIFPEQFQPITSIAGLDESDDDLAWDCDPDSPRPEWPRGEMTQLWLQMMQIRRLPEP
jgi:hypothetical protein